MDYLHSKPIWTRKNALLGLLILGILVAALWAYAASSTPTGSDVFTIGVITPLSGQLANYGNGTRNAAELAVSELNQDRPQGAPSLQLIFEDSPCDPAIAVTAANKLIATDQADALLGPMCSGELLAIAPLVNQHRVTTLSTSATSPDVSSAGDFVFRDVASDDLRAIKFAEYIFSDARVDELTMIHTNDDAANAYADAFSKRFEELGGTISAEEVFEKDSSDMRTQLQKIKSSGSGNVLLLGFPAETGNVLRQSKELDLNVGFFQGFEVMSDPQVAQIAEDAIEGVVYIQSSTVNTVASDAFAQVYRSRFGSDPPYYAAEAYDAVFVLDSARQRAGNGSAFNAAMYATRILDGASGQIVFDPEGDVDKPFEIGRVENGKLVRIKIV